MLISYGLFENKVGVIRKVVERKILLYIVNTVAYKQVNVTSSNVMSQKTFS